MSKHTPGTWIVGFSDGSGVDEGAYITAANDVVVVRGGCPDESLRSFGVQRAEDARLIAAAPELLEALCLSHDHLALTHESFYGEPDEVLKQIRSAIAKARGES